MDSMKDLLDEYGSGFHLAPGDVIEGRLVSILKDQAVIDIGFMYDAVCDIKELTEKEIASFGMLMFIVVKIDDNMGEVILSRKQMRERETRNDIESARPVDIRIVSEVKGGFRADCGGIKGFVPYSHASYSKVQDPQDMVGKSFRAVCIEHSKGSYVFSVKNYENDLRQKEITSLISHLKVDSIYEGYVSRYVNGGVLVDIGGVTGLLAVREMSWKNIRDVKEALKIGDRIKVKLIEIDQHSSRLQFSLKDLVNDPWLSVNEDYEIGEVVEGKVIRNLPHSTLVELDSGVVGMIPQGNYTSRTQPGMDTFLPVKVLEIDAHKRKILLKQHDYDEYDYVDYMDNIDKGSATLGDLFAEKLKKLK